MFTWHSCNPDAVGVMELFKTRFPQATVLAYDSERDMITALKEWRRDYVDQFSDNNDVDTDRIVRFDSCVNGYGMNTDTCNILCVSVSGWSPWCCKSCPICNHMSTLRYCI